MGVDRSAGHEAQNWLQRNRRGIPIAIILLMMAMVAIQIGGFLYTSRHQDALLQLRNDTREMRIIQQALVDQRQNLEDHLDTGEATYLQSFLAGSAALGSERQAPIRRLDAFAGGPVVSAEFRRLDQIWARSVALAEQGERAQAKALVAGPEARALLAQVRGQIARYIDAQNERGSRLEAGIAFGGNLVLVLEILSGSLTLLFLLLAFRNGTIESRARRGAINDAIAARRQVECLFEMTDMLQSAADYDDAHAVLSATAARLLPHLGGRLYVFNNSRDRLDLLVSWNDGDEDSQPIAPSSCWALKRGKCHVNEADPGSLLCRHHMSGTPQLEMPMIARGEVNGLLAFCAEGSAARQRLEEARPLIAALADAVSLAFSNISLREKLRTQALRDPLTGLYNRRYMEDMLHRFMLLSERNNTPLSVVMIDLDHFKRLNDEHGHLVGDAVLRAVAGAIGTGLRETDVACRFGGEELTVLLPDCGLDDAVMKAELLRARIEAVSGLHGATVTASLGVAATPETAGSIAELLSRSDAALYEAKRSGRNRVVAAPRTAQPEFSLAAE